MGLRMSIAGTSGSKAGQTFAERTRMRGDALVGQRSLSTCSTWHGPGLEKLMECSHHVAQKRLPGAMS